jgi:hypothetical protein
MVGHMPPTMVSASEANSVVNSKGLDTHLSPLFVL